MKRVLSCLLTGVRSSKLLSQLIGAPVVKRLKNTPSMTPKGYVPVCVGVDGDTKRFMIHTTLFRHADFSELLYKSAEEYGFCNDGVLRIPYEAKDFENHWMIKRSKPKIYKTLLDNLCRLYTKALQTLHINLQSS
ncbi:auxin-responsive protein SAUR72-like [Pyrus x bretschneideri]|uniref:auxin-responsive protein SAUR72-like n=1 Tax=Pyrus x bretschneideri TaxID=225117 RepID=UPI00202E9371|nr:auxin-responsive protein SAUR72-like [Pyrus x bretschneideri]